MNTYVIAEIGSTHANSLETALFLVDACAKAGVSACKFQYWSDAKRLAERRHAPEMAEKYAAFQMPVTWLLPLKHRCQEQKVQFGCTAYLPEDLPTLAPLVDFWKIASFEAGDIDFYLAHERFSRRPTYISTGLSTAEELEAFKGWYDFPEVYLLHCISGYPTPLTEVSLAVINAYGLDGFSDHTGEVCTGGLAVMAGAKIIEVHVKPLDCHPKNPDFPHSLTPWQLGGYLGHVRRAEIVIGAPHREIQPSEQGNVRYRVRR